ncbi:unnamed protein product [Effrenium voratum]|uniref:Apple domain-containing protein n=1 Tax=Effrenium voratum TaxID=2562239 RepID=A0AA36HN41_9DINO|nr:unnamed protein product [Effrenium voratum]
MPPLRPDLDFRVFSLGVRLRSACSTARHGWGFVHVYKSLVGMKINKLYNFGLYAEGSQELSISRCRDWCYSSMGCQYWQYSKNDGCSADAPSLSTSHDKDPTNMVDYPLTSSSVTTGTPEAASVIAGEYLVHYCPPESNQVASSPSPAPLPGGFYQETKENSGPSVPVMVIALLLILAAIGALGYYWMNHKSSRKVSSHARLAEEDDDDDYSPKMASSAQGQYASSAYQQPPSPPRQPAYGGYGQGGYGQGAQAPTMNFQGQSPMPLLNQGAPYGSARGQPYPGHNARLM